MKLCHLPELGMGETGIYLWPVGTYSSLMSVYARHSLKEHGAKCTFFELWPPNLPQFCLRVQWAASTFQLGSPMGSQNVLNSWCCHQWLEHLLLRETFEQGLSPWLRNAKYSWHLSRKRLFWISWWNLFSAWAVLTLAVSSCLCLCPARTLKWHGGVLGWLWALLTSGIGTTQQFSLQRNPCVWFLGDIMHTGLPSVRLGPDNLLRHQGAQVCESLLSAWGKAEVCGCWGKIHLPFPWSPTFFSCKREGQVNNSDSLRWSHSSLEQNRTQEQGAHSVCVFLPGKSTCLLPSLSIPYQSLHHMGGMQLHLQTLCQMKHLLQGNLLPLPLAPCRELRGSALLPWHDSPCTEPGC